jgi:hypothetical protein
MPKVVCDCGAEHELSDGDLLVAAGKPFTCSKCGKTRKLPGPSSSGHAAQDPLTTLGTLVLSEPRQQKRQTQSPSWSTALVWLILLCPLLAFGFKYLLSRQTAEIPNELPEVPRVPANAPALPVVRAPNLPEPAPIPAHARPVERRIAAAKGPGRVADLPEPADIEQEPEEVPADDEADFAIAQPNAEEPQVEPNNAPKKKNARRVRKREPIDPEVKKLIGRLVSAPLPSGKIDAAVKLKEMRARAEPAVEQLGALMVYNRNPDVQRAASEAIERINPALYKLVLPIAVRDFSDVGGGYRDEVIGEFISRKLDKCMAGIHELGPDARAAFPIVWQYVIENPGDDLALKTLVEIAPDEPQVFDGLARMVRPGQNTSANRILAFRLFVRMRDVDAKTFANVAVEAIGADFPDDLRIEAIKVAPTLGKDAKSAIEGLRNAKLDRNETVRTGAEKALKAIEKPKNDPPGAPLKPGQKPV